MSTEKAKKKVKHVRADMELCTGCKLCELACSFIKEGVFDPLKSRIRVHMIGLPEVPVPVYQPNCDYCGGDPNCVKFCTPGALTYSEDNPRLDRKAKVDALALAEEWLSRALPPVDVAD